MMFLFVIPLTALYFVVYYAIKNALRDVNNLSKEHAISQRKLLIKMNDHNVISNEEYQAIVNKLNENMTIRNNENEIKKQRVILDRFYLEGVLDHDTYMKACEKLKSI